MTHEERHEKNRQEHANAPPNRRRYDLCHAINLIKLGIELDRLRRVGVNIRHADRWMSRAKALLDDLLEVSDAIVSTEQYCVHCHHLLSAHHGDPDVCCISEPIWGDCRCMGASRGYENVG